tara:strand:+ start:7680 stop:7997 length:318 start_codon:yes stop_codon:yes gene_type:complete
MKRATKKEFEFRVRKVAGLKARNASRSEIVAYGTREWGVKPRQVDEYLREANQIIATDWDIDRRQFQAELLSQLSTLAQDARRNNQPHVALGCINTMAKISQVIK